MTRELILETLLKEPAIKRYCSIGGEYSDDLYQSTWVRILEMPEQRLIDIHEKGYLLFYVFKISQSIICREQAKYKTVHLYFSPVSDNTEAQICAKMDVDIIKTDIQKNMHWYDGRMFDVYLEQGSYRNVEKQTKIGYNSVKKTIQKVRKHIDGIK